MNEIVGKHVEKLEPSLIAGKNLNVAATVENSLAVSQNVKHTNTNDPAIQFLGI